MVANDEAVTTAWAGVESQYQRRSDLIPNLVNTVKGYAAHEKETLEGVVEARAKATQVTVNADNLTPERFAQFQKAQGELSAALGRLMRITENYPQLRANENFSELQAQLEGTETESTKAASASTRQCRSTTSASAASPATSSPASSALRNATSSKPQTAPNKPRK